MIRSIRAEHKCTDNPLQYRYKMHTHDQYEIVYFVHGDADYVAEGSVYHLKKGDVLISGKSESHYLNVKSESYYERMVVVFDLEDRGDNSVDSRWISLLAQKPLGQNNRFPGAAFSNRCWQYFMERLCSCTERTHQELYLRLMMLELAECFDTVMEMPDKQTANRSTAIISYINQHLYDDLSLDVLCEQFYVSKSQLNRIFREATGSTVWNYILAKRMIRARELLRSGEGPMEVCEKCAFHNYVSFYKAYQKYYGRSPKEDHKSKKSS